MSRLLYQGHGSYRFTTDKNRVIYIDPFAGEGYDKPADLVIVTHEHTDHNKVSLISFKDGGVLLRENNLLIDGKYVTYEYFGIRITGTPASNLNHDPKKCVGVILEFDGKKIYCAGDTSTTAYMMEVLPKIHLDYAILPIDGVFNMGPGEATKCADAIGARHSIPVHTKPGSLFDIEVAEKFTPVSRLIMHPGESITL